MIIWWHISRIGNSQVKIPRILIGHCHQNISFNMQVSVSRHSSFPPEHYKSNEKFFPPNISKISGPGNLQKGTISGA